MSQKRKTTPIIVLSAVAGALVLVVCFGLIGGLLSSGDDEQAVDIVPAYTVTGQKGGDITVEVDQVLTADQVKAIAVDLRSKQTKENGYYVSINCSTGGTEKVDNRLANARFGIGAIGAARTGLDDGQIDVQLNKDRTCPAD